MIRKVRKGGRKTKQLFSNLQTDGNVFRARLQIRHRFSAN